MTPASLQKTILELNDFVSEASHNLKYRSKPQDFTRKRLLPFNVVVILVLSAMKRTVDLELKVVFGLLDVPDCPTSSATTQARRKLAAEFFADWLKRQVELFYACPHETYAGFRLIAVDGSMMFLPDNPATRKAYPPVSNKGEPMQARVLCCYDVLNHYAVDTRLGPSSRTEIDMAFDCLDSFGASDILIYDRHFPGWGLIRKHQIKGIPFVMRCKVSFNKVVKAFVEGGELEAVVQFKATKKSVDRLSETGVMAKIGECLTVRLIRVDIGGKEPEILITSLMDTAQFPHAVFKELYFKRWGVETFFDKLKNKLQVEVFSGESVQSIQQDFHAIIFLANLQSMMEGAIQPQIEENTKGRRHVYQVNRNKAIGLLKQNVVPLFCGAKQAKTLKKLLAEMGLSRYLEPVRKGRTVKRPRKRKRVRTKHNHSSNFKRAI